LKRNKKNLELYVMYDNELTPVVSTLKHLGIKSVAIHFEGVLLPLEHKEEHWLLPEYNKINKEGAALQASKRISSSFRTFIITLIAHGMRVFIVTTRTSEENGNPHELHGVKGFVYEGDQWVRHVLRYWTHEKVNEHLTVIEQHQKSPVDMLKRIGSRGKVKRNQVMLCSTDPVAIGQARNNHFQGLFVTPEHVDSTFLT